MKLNAGHKEALRLFSLAATVAMASWLMSEKDHREVIGGIIIYSGFCVWTIWTMRKIVKQYQQ